MPLKKGGSQKTVSSNIGELLRSYNETGKIGNTKPGNATKARQIAAAIAYQKAKLPKHLRKKGE